MAGKKLVNDPVHGMIEIPWYAQPVIATPLFQRLGRIKQLGCLDKVWPSAVHTRLEHSLGTMHLAHTYARMLEFDAYEEQVFVLASLLHDIAHGPFSHTFERAIVNTPTGALFGDHDTFRVRLIQENPELVAALGERCIGDIVHVWNGSEPEEPYMRSHVVLHELLAGVAGVDRMDYILRDSYHTTPQRRLDATCIQSIMHHTTVDWKDDDENESVESVIYSTKGRHYVKHLLQEREYLYREVYTHRRAVAGDALITQAFNAGLAHDVLDLIDPIKYERLDDAFILSCAWTDKPYSPVLMDFIRGRLPVTATSDKRQAHN